MLFIQNFKINIKIQSMHWFVSQSDSFCVGNFKFTSKDQEYLNIYRFKLEIIY